MSPLAIQEPRDISPKAIVDFVERVRIELTTIDSDNHLDALEISTWNLETRLACNTACADALLTYALANPQNRVDPQHPWIFRLRLISEASREGGARRNWRSESAVAAITMYWGRDIVND